jgi:hypothetical protein
VNREAGALPHVEKRGDVDVALLVPVFVAAVCPQPVESADEPMVHARPLDQLLERHGTPWTEFITSDWCAGIACGCDRARLRVHQIEPRRRTASETVAV